MNILDLFVVVVLAVACAFGLWKGLVRQIATVVGIVAGYVVAMAFYGRVAAMISGVDPGIAKVIAFLALFFGCLLVAGLLGYLVDRIFAVAGLTLVNRLAGAVVGLMLGWIAVSVVAVMFVAFLPMASPVLAESATLPALLEAEGFLIDLVPDDVSLRYKGKLMALKAKTLGKGLMEKGMEAVEGVKDVVGDTSIPRPDSGDGELPIDPAGVISTK